MSATTDTLRTAETLHTAGVPQRQAAAHARAIDQATSDLVTREYLDMRLRADLADLERRLYRALLIQTAAIVGAIVALMRLLL